MPSLASLILPRPAIQTFDGLFELSTVTQLHQRYMFQYFSVSDKIRMKRLYENPSLIIMCLFVCLFTGGKHDRTVPNSDPIVSALSGHGFYSWYVTLQIFT